MPFLTHLLEEIRRNPAAAAALGALLSSVVALLAVLGTMIATGVNFFTARRQVRATVVSAKRQDWINSLREELAKAIHLLSEISSLYDKWGDNQQFITEISDPAAPEPKALRNLQRDFSFSKARISLLINPQNENHALLCQELNLAYDMVHCPPALVKGIGKQIKAVVRISQTILKEEWGKVKSLR